MQLAAPLPAPADVDWGKALLVLMAVGLLLLVSCTRFVENCRGVCRLLGFLWRQKDQLFATAMVLSEAMVQQSAGSRSAGSSAELPPLTHVKGKKHRRGRTMRPPS
jgi:hypothetical protein